MPVAPVQASSLSVSPRFGLKRQPHSLKAAHQPLGLFGVGQLAGELLNRLKLFEQTVDVYHLGTRTGGDALFQAGVKQDVYKRQTSASWPER